jgi:RNA polymerase sigma factor (sigma-70 family)
MESLQLNSEARRYAPIVRAQAIRLRDAVFPEVDLKELVDFGNEGLMAALQSFRKRQGTTFQTFAHYHIRAAILNGLKSAELQSPEQRIQRMFLSKANQFLQWYSSSSEGFVKRSLDAESAELYQLCQRLAVIYLLCCAALDQISDAIGFRENLISHLEERDRALVEFYYFQNNSIQECAGHLKVSLSVAQRSHFRILTSFAEILQDSGNRNSI